MTRDRLRNRQGIHLSAFLLACVFAVTLGACGFQPAGDPAEKNVTRKEASAATPADKEKTTEEKSSEFSDGKAQPTELLLFWHAMADPEMVSLRQVLKEKLEQQEIQYHEYDAENNDLHQASQIQEALSQYGGVKDINTILFIDPVGEGRSYREACLQTDYKAAGDAAVIVLGDVEGDPRISADGLASESPVSVWQRSGTLYFTGDSRAAGQLQGEMVRDYLLSMGSDADFDGDGELTVCVLSLPEQKDRMELCLDAVSSESGLRLQVLQPELYTVEDAVASLDELLSNPGFSMELILCGDDETASRILVKLQSYGYNLGDGICLTVPLFGFGGTTVCKANVDAGMMEGTVEPDWESFAEALIDGAAHLQLNHPEREAEEGSLPVYEEIRYLPYVCHHQRG